MKKRFNIKDWQKQHLHECNGNCGCGCNKGTIKEATYLDSHAESKLNNIIGVIKQVYKAYTHDEPTKNHKKIKQEILKYIEKAL